MKTVNLPLCVATASLLSVVGLIGCGQPAGTGDNSKTHIVPMRDWPDLKITGGDGEVANLQHLSIDQKAVDVWSTWGRGNTFSREKILIGLRDHTRDEIKNWKVRITCPTIWAGGFTTATIKIADGRFAQHPDYINGVVVYDDGHEYNVQEPGGHKGLNVGSHTITVEILDEQDRVKGLATLPMTIFRPSPRDMSVPAPE
jgi:hypothetical protein